ncbi:MAG: hypothetical protein JRI47_05220 [Deltaproteobacteria bacterium]|nr:hypothetical protein [Deltaproteobacteria bacterium]
MSEIAACDYLACALIDAVVDHYFIILELFAEKMYFLQKELISDPERETLKIDSETLT